MRLFRLYSGTDRGLRGVQTNEVFLNKPSLSLGVRGMSLETHSACFVIRRDMGYPGANIFYVDR